MTSELLKQRLRYLVQQGDPPVTKRFVLGVGMIVLVFDMAVHLL